jgi:hypothetical protein
MYTKKIGYEKTRELIIKQYELGPYVKADEIVDNVVVALESICKRYDKDDDLIEELINELVSLFAKPLTCVMPSYLHEYVELELLPSILSNGDKEIIIATFISEIDDIIVMSNALKLLGEYEEYNKILDE